MMARSESLPAALARGLREAALIAGACAAVAAGSNAVRRERLPLVQKEAYPLVVPCPETHGTAEGLAASDPRLAEKGVLLVDARAGAAFQAWHAPGAMSIVYDFLDPVSDAAVQALLKSRASMVAVYGDGGEPDSGRELARELSGKGVRNVVFVRGGAKALGASP
jgi:rhodanese-related sulfurtransferase